MQTILFFASLFLAPCNNVHQMNDTTFTAERITQTASILLNDRVDKVFPLFGAFEERKWSEGWNPTLIYPKKEIIEEGTTFMTPGHGHDENQLIWTVSKINSSGRCRNLTRPGS